MSGEDSHIRVDDLWFSNDNLVIKAQQKIFRVSKSVLAARSTVFQDMVAFPQPTEGGTELIDGSPVVSLHDSADDVEVFLRAIFDSSYFMPPPESAKLQVILGILRLSHKYDVQYLHRRALKHLSAMYYRASVHDYLNITAIDHIDYADADHEPLRHLKIILAATEVGAEWLLPLAYYSASSNRHADLLALLPSVPDRVIHKCLLGQTELVRGTAAVARFLIRTPDKYRQCTNRENCNDNSSLICDGVVFHQFSRNLDLDPLHQWVQDAWKTIRPAFCEQCYEQARATHRLALEAFWDRLPAIFGVPEWPELHARQTAAMKEGS
ncbi:hypothetical protein DFH09DRAFT_1152409 [Mycena vulgaris]|nr:hypothetical protein DFH09DRAFT_1152409 [Mycena vulgaris]